MYRKWPYYSSKRNCPVKENKLTNGRILASLDKRFNTYSHVSPDMQDEMVKRFGSLFS